VLCWPYTRLSPSQDLRSSWLRQVSAKRNFCSRRPGDSTSSHRRTGLELSNGSVIEALPAVERTMRGFSVDLLICDEAAAVPDEDYFGILPSLIAMQGKQVLLSTPRGKRGFFHEIWHGAEDWQRMMVRSDEVGRIRPEDLEVFRATMPQQFFQQEFYCEWLDTDGALFAHDDIEGALSAGENVVAIQIGDDEW
jgi:hypothetical protein